MKLTKKFAAYQLPEGKLEASSSRKQKAEKRSVYSTIREYRRREADEEIRSLSFAVNR
ncbi:hypothetical protein [Anaerobacillus arseniciselenatis]|uniref:hypothetical protein n=1 Tax=Anaerobacillus arseniciselenatis TaxID=85682 RepID=UPI001470B91E|nr:hypothetical protein [Anaerobacillus arseniciselenatis]